MSYNSAQPLREGAMANVGREFNRVISSCVALIETNVLARRWVGRAIADNGSGGYHGHTMLEQVERYRRAQHRLGVAIDLLEEYALEWEREDKA